MLPPPTPADEPRRLQALRSLCLLDTPPHERFDRIVRAASHLFRVPIALVSLVDEGRQWFKARQGLSALETPRELSFCGHAILSPATFVVPDALRDPRFHDNPLVLGAPFVRFYAGHPLRAGDGSRVGTLCLIDSQPRDFSDADRAALVDMAGWAEVELNALDEREARAALEQQERFFEVSVDMLCIAAMDGTFLRLSRAWNRTLGFSDVELYSSSLVDLALEEDRASTARHLARASEGAPVLQFEHRARCRDGSWRWLQWNAVPDPEEGLLYAVARDVTQARLLAEEHQRVERMKNEFISTVSHELRTPLTSIRGSLGLLCGGIAGPLDSQVEQMVGIAHKNSERLLRLINDILDLEKMESGGLDLHMASTPVAPLLTLALQAHQGYAAEYGVRLEVAVDAPHAHARVDEDRFIQVLANLLSNAIKFSPRGERVTLSLTREAGALRVGVQDRGPGIPEAFQARVFQKFAQADASDTRKRSGTGLGLSIAHGLVSRMGGTLRFTTAPGAGTRFSFDLPECEPAPDTAHDPGPTP
ncbi:GAF domain-containing sensor histidine kinase [Corallococcus silvisoli]|uniref:GAF domain-containing sensor histidine kinase n=1 Tax=Corallococcus silvisoli TaxID=2697031 RepID=UPI0013777039|nr:ATP-binding protein [Corallococcus silvisoli]NBD12704.1 PAS domain S-box protein [Corallococcus silvisoli]